MTFFLRKIYYYFRSVHPLPKRTQYARGTHDNDMVVNIMFFFIFAFFFFFISWFLNTWQWLKNDIFITAKITNSMSKLSRLLFLFCFLRISKCIRFTLRQANARSIMRKCFAASIIEPQKKVLALMLEMMIMTTVLPFLQQKYREIRILN